MKPQTVKIICGLLVCCIGALAILGAARITVTENTILVRHPVHFLFKMIEDEAPLEDIQAALEKQPELIVTCRDQGGDSLLTQAVFERRSDLVQLLLRMGADPNGNTDDAKNSPLRAAIVRKDVKNARLLLEHGANPNMIFKSGVTAFTKMSFVLADMADDSDEMAELFREFKKNAR